MGRKESNQANSYHGKYGRGTFTILRTDRILTCFFESSQEFSLMVSMGEEPLPYSELAGFSLVFFKSSQEFSNGKHGRGTFTILRAFKMLTIFLESSQEFSPMSSMGEGRLPYTELSGFSPVS